MTVLATPFNLFGMDGLLIFLILLLLFGAKKLPELAKGLGQAVREFGKAKDEFEREITHPPQQPEPPRQLEEPRVADHTEVHPPGETAAHVPSQPADGSNRVEPQGPITQRLVPATVATGVEGTEPQQKS
jgi:sec-independent protein translocase protein TatA